MKNALLFLYTETSLHAGTGSGLSAVDLPIQRERTTQYPIVQGSGVKGAIRSQAGGGNDEKNAIFGPDGKNGSNASDHAGAISFGEARILLFPVRSLVGVFAYVTCPHVLSRLKRDVASAYGEEAIQELPEIQVASDQCYVSNAQAVSTGGKVVLEEFSFNVQKDPKALSIADWMARYALPEGPEYDFWRTKVQSSLVILSDDAFRDFVVNSTEISTHVRLDPNKKTVETGALWTSESLPSDCLLYSMVTARKARKEKDGRDATAVLDWVTANITQRIQIGGDETTGQGFVALRWII